ncbi:methyltransferase [Robertkochia flava]|uniref:methyltransferase n=1 Tax=Robertkochia flava TaxID=3447986 RepID=UPI001CCD8829|nr:methyltransferase [Robertkochia marina]
MYEHTYPEKRYRITLDFLKSVAPEGTRILDLGIKNPFGEIMKKEGFLVENTGGEDLDEDRNSLSRSDAELVTALEIFEHLLSPYEVLKSIKADKIVASIPLRLWFSNAYRSKTDPWDRHYHEFEEWQFDWLLEKTGWEIKKRKRWTHPVKKIGFRPLLRLFTPRYYMVYAERVNHGQ